MLGNSTLEMGVHGTESKQLRAGLAWLLEGVVSKSSVIKVIVLDADNVLGGKLLKCLPGKDGLSGGVVILEVHEMQSGEVVHKSSAIPVPVLCERPLQLGKKAHLC